MVWTVEVKFCKKIVFFIITRIHGTLLRNRFGNLIAENLESTFDADTIITVKVVYL